MQLVVWQLPFVVFDLFSVFSPACRAEWDGMGLELEVRGFAFGFGSVLVLGSCAGFGYEF